MAWGELIYMCVASFLQQGVVISAINYDNDTTFTRSGTVGEELINN